MASEGWIGKAAFGFALALVAVGAPTHLAAQKTDIGLIEKRYRELTASGQYPAALAEAQKLEGAVKTRFGPQHPGYAIALANVAVAYTGLGRYVEAEELHRRAIAIREKAPSTSPVEFAWHLGQLAAVYIHQARYEDAEALYQRALALEQGALGEQHPKVATTLDNLGNVKNQQGRFGKSEELRRRAVAMLEGGNDQGALAIALSNLAFVSLKRGRASEAEALYKRALSIKEAALGLKHPSTAFSLNNLGGLYQSQGRFIEAEGLLKRGLEIRERVLPPNHPDLAWNIGELARVYASQGRYSEAEKDFKRALAIQIKALGEKHPSVAETLDAFATMYSEHHRYAEAEELYKSALIIDKNSFLAINNLAELYSSMGRYSDAEELFKRALSIVEQNLGREHPTTAYIHNNLAGLYRAVGNDVSALAYSRRATAAIISHATAEFRGSRRDSSAGLLEQRAPYFLRHVANLAAAARAGIEPAPVLGNEALENAQSASQSAAAAALQQMAVRFASGAGALAILVRERQDLTALWRDRDKGLIEELSKAEGQRNQTLIESIRKQIAGTENDLAAVAVRLEKEFPDHAALANPKPLRAEQVQRLIRADEALVFLLVGDNESYVFALTAAGFDWKVIELSGEALSRRVPAFRRGLDVNEFSRSIEAGKPELFDLALAHELYGILLGPIEPLVKDKAKLMIVPTGVLTALPFHLLVTEKPAEPGRDVDKFAPYRNAAWLIRRQAVSVLPSVASLKSLRGFARTDLAMKPMIGFGDPVFGDEGSAAEQTARGRAVATRSYTDFWQGLGVDRAKLAQALPRLADTADELKAVAQKLGAADGDIKLRQAATEATVKRLPLADYRIVYFATHGLVAGDIKGLAEPSLALTIPRQATENDDGLLTASEVAQLKLNADWVVLSACNTIAGDKPGAEALSGLARAFFYAGARALLVSHWAVASDAATELTTSTFDILKTDPSLGRAEALRRAMLAYLDDPVQSRNAYPAFWAPFSLVGEGAAN